MAQVVHKVSPAVVHERIHASPEQIADFRRVHHIQWLALFGSVLHDDFRDDSDVDVLVECDPEHPVTFFDLHEVEEELSRLFGGCEVDLITRAAMNWRMRDRVLRRMVVLYAEYDADTMLRYALAGALRRFSARSAQVSHAFRAAHREIAWDKTDAMYRAVSEDAIAIDEGVLWEIAIYAMPALIPMLERIVPQGIRYLPDEPSRGVHG